MASTMGSYSGRIAAATSSRTCSNSSPTHTRDRTARARSVWAFQARSRNLSSRRRWRITFSLVQDPFEFLHPLQEVCNFEPAGGVGQDGHGRPDLVGRLAARQV